MKKVSDFVPYAGFAGRKLADLSCFQPLPVWGECIIILLASQPNSENAALLLAGEEGRRERFGCFDGVFDCLGSGGKDWV